MRIKLPQNIGKAVEMYYSKIELSTKDIIELFECSKSSANKLKQMAIDLMVAEGKIPFNKANVLTSIAYRAWSIDIVDLEKRYIKLKKMFGG